VQQDIQTVNDQNIDLTITSNVDGKVSPNTTKNDCDSNATVVLKAVKIFKSQKNNKINDDRVFSRGGSGGKFLRISSCIGDECETRIMRSRSKSFEAAQATMVTLRIQREAAKKERKRGVIRRIETVFLNAFLTISKLFYKRPEITTKPTFLPALRSTSKRLQTKRKGDQGMDSESANKIRAFYEEKAKCFSPIFLFNSRWLFLTSVELIIQFNCVWMSLLVTNYAVMMETSPNETQWATLLAIVFAVLVPILGLAVRKSAMIAAITELDLEAFDKVLTMTEEADELVGELSQKLNDRIEELQMDDDRSRTQIITDLFNEIDLDGSGQITKIEFSRLLHRVGISFSDAKMLNLYYAIDTDKGGSISIAEFNSVVFGISGDKSEGLELTSQIPTSAIQ